MSDPVLAEATRRQYLALLGIEQWLPRDAVDELVAEAAAPVVPALPVTAPAAPPAPVAPAPTAALIPEPAPVAMPPPAPAAPPSAPAERTACCLWVAGDGLLLVAMLASPDAPGLGGPEHALLANIAAALLPAVAGQPEEFHWPPPGVRLPGVDRPGAAAEALAARLAVLRAAGVRDLLQFGASAVVADAAARAGLVPLVVPALPAMLADPALKRTCWEAARPLRRQP